MAFRRVHQSSCRGFTAVELIVVMAILGIIALLSIPSLISYWRAATVKAAAEELAAGLNRGRQLAVSRNQSVCAEVVGNQYRYRINGCAGAIWTGPGSDTNGLFTLANNVTLSVNPAPGPAFDYLGAATPGATFTVTDLQSGLARNVVVSVSGRVQIQ